MRPLSDTRPKPLLEVGGCPLIVHQIQRLRDAGFTHLVINHAWLGHLIEGALGTGEALGVHIAWSREADRRLETGGGIFNALPLLGKAPFLVVNADVWTDYPFAALRRPFPGRAHLVLVRNPAHHPVGDFVLGPHGRVTSDGAPRLTYTGLAVLDPALFDSCRPGAFPLAPLLRKAAARGEVTGECYRGLWRDVGTPEALASLQGARSGT